MCDRRNIVNIGLAAVADHFPGGKAAMKPNNLQTTTDCNSGPTGNTHFLPTALQKKGPHNQISPKTKATNIHG